MNLSREKTEMAPPLKERKFSRGIPHPLGAFEDSGIFEPKLPSAHKIHYIFTFFRFTFV